MKKLTRIALGIALGIASQLSLGTSLSAQQNFIRDGVTITYGANSDLTIEGSEGDDEIEVKPALGLQAVRISINGVLLGPPFVFSNSGSIYVVGGGGNDVIRLISVIVIDNGIKTNRSLADLTRQQDQLVFVNGDEGNDDISPGLFSSGFFIYGGDGNDDFYRYVAKGDISLSVDAQDFTFENRRRDGERDRYIDIPFGAFGVRKFPRF